jgi:hypothetical protein
VFSYWLLLAESLDIDLVQATEKIAHTRCGRENLLHFLLRLAGYHQG